MLYHSAHLAHGGQGRSKAPLVVSKRVLVGLARRPMPVSPPAFARRVRHYRGSAVVFPGISCHIPRIYPWQPAVYAPSLDIQCCDLPHCEIITLFGRELFTGASLTSRTVLFQVSFHGRMPFPVFSAACRESIVPGCRHLCLSRGILEHNIALCGAWRWYSPQIMRRLTSRARGIPEYGARASQAGPP